MESVSDIGLMRELRAAKMPETDIPSLVHDWEAGTVCPPLGRFHRTFTLSQELDPEKIAAALSNGVLRLSIPKAEHAKPRRIAVSAA